MQAEKRREYFKEKLSEVYKANETLLEEKVKAYKRIHQVMTIEDAECFVQYVDGKLSGFVMGYYKEFDDLKAYFLEEIVIFSEFQNKGYGVVFIRMCRKTPSLSYGDIRHVHRIYASN